MERLNSECNKLYFKCKISEFVSSQYATLYTLYTLRNSNISQLQSSIAGLEYFTFFPIYKKWKTNDDIDVIVIFASFLYIWSFFLLAFLQYGAKTLDPVIVT